MLSVYITIGVFGTIIGSFLNDVIYRLHTGRSLDGRSHCMSCGKILSWRELFPVFSYMLLRGKCRGCEAYIPSRYFVVEVLTGLLFMLMWHVFSGDILLLALNLLLASLFVIIAVYDVRHTIIPDELSVGVGIIALAYVGYGYVIEQNTFEMLMSIVAGLGAGGFFAGLWYLSKGRWIGLGDAKLALPLGIIVGLGDAFSMVVLSFWVGAILSLLALGVRYLAKKWKTHLRFTTFPRTMGSEIPFAPFLILGFLLVHVFQVNIFDITYALFFW